MRGTLTDGISADVYVCWGTADGGTETAAWQNVIGLVNLDEGAFATNVTAYYGPRYYYRCYAINDSGEAWAPATTNFFARRPSVAGSAGDGRPSTLARCFPAHRSERRAAGGPRGPTPRAAGTTPCEAARSPAGYPHYKEDVLNGKPVVRFSTDGSSWFGFTVSAISGRVLGVEGERRRDRTSCWATASYLWDFHRCAVVCVRPVELLGVVLREKWHDEDSWVTSFRHR